MSYLVNGTHLLTGDSLFIRGCGRTDFQSGNAGMMYDAITQRLFTLPDETLVYPGHDYRGNAGFLVFIGTLLGAFVSPWFLLLSGFVGAGLMFAGITDSCVLGMLLSKLPYNQRSSI